MEDTTKYDALLIYPPLVKLGIHTYYLSLSILAAELKKKSIKVKQLDLNRDSLYDFLVKENLIKVKDFCQEKIRIFTGNEVCRLYKELLVEVEYGIKNIELINKAKEIGDFRIDDVELSKIFHRLFEFMENGEKINGEGSTSEIDFFDEFYNEQYIDNYISRHVTKDNACILFSITMGPQLKPAMSMSKSIKKLFPHTKIIFGGPVISLMPNEEHEKILCVGDVDILMRYEGEVELPKLIKRIMYKDSFDDVFNITYLKSKVFCSNKNKYNTCNFDTTELPYYDEEIINKYKIDMISVLQSRGCYWKRCSFCDYTNLYGNYNYHVRKPERLCEEIKELKEKYGIKRYQIINESMTANYAKNFSKEILDSGLDIEWSTFIKIEKDCFDEKTLRLMKQSGCKKVTIGVESLDDTVLENLNKGYKREYVLVILEALARVNIQTVVNIIVDAPVTKWESALEQFEIFRYFSKKMNVTYNYFSFELTRTSDMGKNPSKYGLEIVDNGYLEQSMKGMVKNTFNYTHKYKWSEQRLNALKTAYYNLNLISRCKNEYPNNYQFIKTIIKNKKYDDKYKIIINEKNKMFKYEFSQKEEYMFILHNSVIFKNNKLIECVYNLIRDRNEITVKEIINNLGSTKENGVFSSISDLMLYDLVLLK
ncbi:radical SAM protein [Clostridiaceae bacterium M8S5]|nr:radical SAM protein [Clostridiaceae bacterium M8S5]